jgi:dTDP-4-dehydrorhamnose reductase
MRILLTGKMGQVGFELRRSLAILGHVRAIGSGDCDFRDELAIREAVRAYRPDVIVNPAAYTSVDQAESDSKLAYAINAKAPAVLAEEAQAINAIMVHYSTDYVFDGSNVGGYVESDAPRPLGVYGASKLGGERGVANACKRHIILRTSWVLGANGRNFARTILRLGSEKEVLSVVSDQWGSPTSASILADITAHVVRQVVDTDSNYGLYHVAGVGKISWHAYAVYVINRAREAGLLLRVSPDRIKAITTAEYPTATKRPINSYLDSSRINNIFGIHVPDWKIGVDHVLDQIISTNYANKS